MATDAPQPPSISVIVVNYDGRHLLESCLRSLENQTLPRHEWELLLIDNASRDDSIAYVRQNFPWVRSIVLPRNVGFAAGNNVGFLHAQGQYFALLNNDAVAAPDWLAALQSAIRQSPGIGGIASKISFRHNQTEINSAGLVLYRDGRGGDRGFRERDQGQFDHCSEVFGVCGAGALIHRQLIEELGGFDERLFMYYEDLDLCWRGRLRGWKFAYEPRAIVHHAHCATSGEGSPFFCFHVERNRALVSMKNGDLFLALRSGLGLVARAGRGMVRFTFGRSTAAHAVAPLRALAAVLVQMPRVLRDRFRIRTALRNIPDSEIRSLMTAPPRRAA